MDIINLSLPQMAAALNKKELSARDLVDSYLKRIEKYDGEVNAYLHVAADLARKEALRWDEKRAAGEVVPYTAGLPVAMKDLILTKDMPTTCASKMLEGFYAPYDASVVKMLKAAGYINLGKLNMDQFAMGSSGETSYFKKTANPWDLTRVPGGSSSGSVASVAARLAPVAIGSDTGGSIRQPSGFCGVTGMKPTYGRVSRYGVVSYASSLDQLGPVGRSVEDVAFLLDTIGQFDAFDSTFNQGAVPEYYKTIERAPDDMKGLKLGLPKGFITDGLAPDVKMMIMRAIDKCAELGAEIVEVELPHAEIGLQVYQMIATAEASSNLAKFDGIQYGYRAERADLSELYSDTREEGFGPEVKKRIILGTYVLQEAQYQDYYVRAMKIRRLLRNDYDKAFKKCDLIIGPTSSTTAFTFGDKSRTPLEMYLNDLYTVTLNLNGSCGITIPAGLDSKGLPTGLQFQGDMFAEEKLLTVSHIFQKNTNWHKVVPEKFA